MATIDGDRTEADVDRISEQILQARAERKRVEAAFDAFTSGFRGRHAHEAPDAFAPPPPSKRIERTRPAAIATPAVAVDAEEPPIAPDLPGSTVPSRPARPRAGVLAIAGIAVVAVAVVAIQAWQGNREVAAPEATPPSAVSAPQTPVDAPVPAATPQPAPPVVASGVNVDLRTRRRVWMRVTLDGVRAFEREVPADEHIPLHADRSIVIRAGDAGAVAVTRGGRDLGPLGRDGVVATREYTTDRTSRR